MNDLIDRNSLLKSLEKFAPEKHDALVEMLIKKEPTVDAIPLDWIMQWYQRNVSGRTDGKYIMRTVIRELLDAWDAERDE